MMFDKKTGVQKSRETVPLRNGCKINPVFVRSSYANSQKTARHKGAAD